jgi:hypothetical protein
MNMPKAASNALRRADLLLEIINLHFHLRFPKFRGSERHNFITQVAQIQKSEFINVTYSYQLRRSTHLNIT